jgi:hypothetical protein
LLKLFYCDGIRFFRGFVDKDQADGKNQRGQSQMHFEINSGGDSTLSS